MKRKQETPQKDNKRRRISNGRPNDKKPSNVKPHVKSNVNVKPSGVKPTDNKRKVEVVNQGPVKRARITNDPVKETTKGPVKETKTPKLVSSDDLKLDNTLWLKKFPMETLRVDKTHDGKRVLIVGMSGSGKSTAALDIMRFNKDIPVWMIISLTEEENHTFGPHVHPACIHNNLNIEALEGFRDRQKKKCKDWSIPNTKPVQYSRNPSAGIVLDDVNVSAKLFKEDIFRWAFFNSRHNRVLWIQLTQYFMLVPVDHRRNLSHVFLFRQNSPKEVKKIYDEFAGVFNKFADFKKALDICTHSYGCMVIDVMNPSTDINKRIFWYRALREQPIWNAGAPWWYAQLDRIYNPLWDEQMPKPSNVSSGQPKAATKALKSKIDMEIKLDDGNNLDLNID